MSEASPATRRFVALVLVAAIHALIFRLARSPTAWRSHDSQAQQSSSVLFFPEIIPAPREPLPIDIRPRLEPSHDISVADIPRLAPTAPSDVAAEAGGNTPSTDWNLEAVRAAAAVVDEAVTREKLQPANGHLLDHMRDPERDKSSVPASH